MEYQKKPRLSTGLFWRLKNSMKKPPADKSRWFLKKSMTAKFYKLFLSVHAHRVDFFTVEKLMRIGEKLVDCRSTDIDSLCSTFGLCAEQLFFPA